MLFLTLLSECTCIAINAVMHSQGMRIIEDCFIENVPTTSLASIAMHGIFYQAMWELKLRLAET